MDGVIPGLNALASALAAQDGYVGEDFSRSYRREAAEIIERLKASGFKIGPTPFDRNDPSEWLPAEAVHG